MSFKITAESDLRESRGTFTLAFRVRPVQIVLFSREHEVLARLLYPLCCCCSSCCCCICWIVTHVQQKDTRWRYCFTQNFVVFLKGDTDASILDGVKIVQI
jgi:hypothetical protein